MRHLEPKTLQPGPTSKRPRKPWTWLLGFLLATLGAGWVTTRLAGTPQNDAVTASEREARLQAFATAVPLRAGIVADALVDARLHNLQLPAPERESLAHRVARTSVAGTPGTPARAEQPLRLLELSLWDTHAPDGDVVVVASAGYSRTVTLTKTPQLITVPVAAAGSISITGLHDGGGGITLGVRGAEQALLMPIMSEGQTIVLPLAP